MPKGIYKRKIKPKILFICSNCGISKYLLPNIAKRKKYCSCKCAAAGKNNPMYGKKRSQITK